MDVFRLNDLIVFSPDQHAKRVFFEKGKVKAQVVGLEAGQAIPPCRMDHDVIFLVTEGKGTIVVDGEEEAIEESAFVFVPKERETRSIKALAKMAVLAIQVKS